MSESTRQTALQCATQIVLQGTWKNASDRANAALRIAAHFTAFLDATAPDEPPPASAPEAALREPVKAAA